MKRFYVLDALRCVLALCVTIGHAGALPLFGPVTHTGDVLDLLARGWRTAIFGPPAVIAFFVISGFCIHYPFAARNERCPIGRFYARRYLRILTPVICTGAMSKLLFPNIAFWGVNSIIWNSTLWSIVCEEIYYALYPLLNRAGWRLGWKAILIASAFPALAACWFFFPAVDWQDVGIIATTITLFPIWLSGCYLAENISVLRREYAPLEMWLRRFAVWGVMWAAALLHFHSSIHQTLSAIGVGVAYYFWIRAELCYYRNRDPWKILVWGGQWSYSLYLIHPIVIALTFKYEDQLPSSRFGWLAVIALVLICSYLFYLVVEKPSHNLARRIPLFGRRKALPEVAPELSLDTGGG